MEKPKDVGHFFYFCACPSHNALKRDAGIIILVLKAFDPSGLRQESRALGATILK